MKKMKDIKRLSKHLLKLENELEIKQKKLMEQMVELKIMLDKA